MLRGVTEQDRVVTVKSVDDRQQNQLLLSQFFVWLHYKQMHQLLFFCISDKPHRLALPAVFPLLLFWYEKHYQNNLSTCDYKYKESLPTRVIYQCNPSKTKDRCVDYKPVEPKPAYSQANLSCFAVLIIKAFKQQNNFT